MNSSKQHAVSSAAAAGPSTFISNGQIVPPAPLGSKSSTTDAFLKDFTLVAEAAKRAQVAVMMRDFENIGI